MDGQVSGLGTVHPLLTLNFLSTWILPLHVPFSMLMKKSSSSAMDGLQGRRKIVIRYSPDAKFQNAKLANSYREILIKHIVCNHPLATGRSHDIAR